MNITLIVNYFPPEIGSAADLFYQLALEFQKKGHIVNVFTTQTRSYNLPNVNILQHDSTKVHKNNLIWNSEKIGSRINVNRVKLVPFIYPRSGNEAFFRNLEHILQPFLFLTLINKLKNSDLILIYSPPLLLGFINSLIGKLFRIPTIINVQDIHPEAIVEIGLLKNPFLISILKFAELQMYRNSDAIVVHSDGNKKRVITHGAFEKKVFVIFNACKIPSETILKEGIIYRKNFNWDGKFVITYAGIMSFSQDLETVLTAAKYLSNELKNIVFILAGNGPQRPLLEKYSKEEKMDNVLFLPFQEGDEYWRLLSASDACLVSLKKSQKSPVVPRKLNDIMAAGRPVIAEVPLEGDAKDFIEKANCGIFVDSGDPVALAEVIKKIYYMPKEERKQYGNNGRLYATSNFSVETISSQYEKLFEAFFKKNDN